MIGLLCALVATQRYNPAPEIGSIAPKPYESFAFKGKNLTGYGNGRVTVIEFWATWCAPCRAAIPHINDLAKQFAGQPIDFYSVTNEEKKTVEEFTKLVHFDTNVVYGAGFLAGQYGVMVIPRTVIVDGQGKIAAITTPEEVTKDRLADFMKGKHVDFPLRLASLGDPNWDKELMAKPGAHAVIALTESSVNYPPRLVGTGQFTIEGIRLLALIGYAYGARNVEIELPDRVGNDRYRASVKAADGKDETAILMLRDQLSKQFGLKGEWNEKPQEVLVLRKEGTPKVRTPSGQAAEKTPGIMSWRNATIAQLTEYFELVLKQRVIDETGIAGSYDFDLHWSPNTNQDLEKGLAEMGLSLKKERRKMKTLVFK